MARNSSLFVPKTAIKARLLLLSLLNSIFHLLQNNLGYFVSISGANDYGDIAHKKSPFK
jgi:hypothetical protein